MNKNYRNVQSKDFFQLTDIKSYVPIICKINPSSSHTGLRIKVHPNSYNLDATHQTAKNYVFKFVCDDPMSESMLIV